jgi:hypothetical protein
VIAACFLFCGGCLKVSDGSNAGLLEFDGGPPRARPESAHPIDAGQPGPGSFRITLSGGDFARSGYRFPPSDAGVPAFVDGWELSFNSVLVGIVNIALWEEPDRSPSDPTQVGAKVAELRGYWVVDLHCPQRGCSDGGISDAGESDGGGSDDGGVIVEGPDRLAVEIANLIDQNLVDHRPFDPARRYAVSFDIVVPDVNARSVNLNNPSDISQMISSGYSVWYRGAANWRGTPSTCVSTDAGFNFATINLPLTFSFGFRTPTTYFNCQNPQLPDSGIGGEPYPRGVIASPNARTTVQLSIRTDQTFSEAYERTDAPIHFDQFSAAAYPGIIRFVQLEDAGYARYTGGLNYTAFPVPWRWCSPELTGYQPPDNNPWMDFRGQAGRSYDPTLTQNLCSDAGYRDYYDLVSNIQGAQGYLNGPGRCAVLRHFRCQPP